MNTNDDRVRDILLNNFEECSKLLGEQLTEKDRTIERLKLEVQTLRKMLGKREQGAECSYENNF